MRALSVGAVVFVSLVGATYTRAASAWPSRPIRLIVPFTPGGSTDILARVPNVLVVNPQVPAKDVRSLIARAKARPGELRYASGGNGSAAHLAMEYFKLRAGVDVVHVPYRGTAPAVTDVLGGQVEMIMTGVPAVQQHVKAGKLRALAVSSGTTVAALPGIPTIAATIPDFEAIQWYGVVVLVGTPAAIVERLNVEINRSLATEKLKERLEAEGAVAAPDSPPAFGALIVSEIARWKPVIERANMRPE